MDRGQKKEDRGQRTEELRQVLGSCKQLRHTEETSVWPKSNECGLKVDCHPAGYGTSSCVEARLGLGLSSTYCSRGVEGRGRGWGRGGGSVAAQSGDQGQKM